MNEFGEPNMGNPSVRFDEGRESGGHWPSGLSTHPLPPTLQAIEWHPTGKGGLVSPTSTTGPEFWFRLQGGGVDSFEILNIPNSKRRVVAAYGFGGPLSSSGVAERLRCR